MGIFDFLTGKKAAPKTDIVWINREAMYKSCAGFISEYKPDIYIAWFNDTVENFNRLLNEEKGMNIQIKTGGALQPYHLDNKKILFLEHYPLYSKEIYLLTGNRPVKICFINSLDDVIFQLFGGNIASIMRGLGLDENEYIENTLVSKSIINAQKRLEKKVSNDFHARSAEEWLNNYRIYFQQNI
jgi:hypothetical protein